MRKLLFFIASLILLSSCIKEPDPITRFSILGDSFSAFEGYVDPDTNDPWSHYSEIGVTGPEMMWWSQVADSMGWVMERNNSFTGTMVSNYDTPAYYAKHSFIRRMNDLGTPDVIFVFGATNDLYYGVPLGDFVYAEWTEEVLCAFRPALAYLLNNLKQMHPKSEIYLMVDMNLCINDGTIDDDIRQEYIDSMHRIANRYHVTSIDLYDIKKWSWHPNAEGQQSIARQVIEALLADFNV